VCDPETRKNCSSLKESLMDIDSNFDDDYNTVNALKKNIKKKEPEIKSKKKVTFDCSDNSSNEETFNYEHENVSDKDILDDEFEDESLSGEETLDEDYDNESMSNEEQFDDDDDETFDYNHEEKFEYDNEKEENLSDSETDENVDLLNNKDDIKTISTKEDIYGRIRKSDGTIVVSHLN